MLLGLVQTLTWIAAGLLAIVVVLLAMNRQAGLKMIGHRVEMLPQAMLVRYGGMALLAAIAAFLGLPSLLAATLFVFAVIGLGDTFIYRRAGLPFLRHLFVGGVALLLALLALIRTD